MMTRQTARNFVLVAGAWSLSGLAAFLITLLLMPISNHLGFWDASGEVIAEVWFGLPQALAAAGAAVTVLWLLETDRRWPWVAGLTVLFMYSGWFARVKVGFAAPPSVATQIGLAIRYAMPALACVAAAIWWMRRQPLTRVEGEAVDAPPRSETDRETNQEP